MPDNSQLDLESLILSYCKQKESEEPKKAQSKPTFIAVKAAGCQTHGLSEMDDGFLNSAHVSQRRTLQQQCLNTVAVQLDGLGSQVESPGVTLAIKTVTAEQRKLKSLMI